MGELDPTLLSACRRGDGRAFRALVETYQDRVYALCAALVGTDAADVTQETFLRVHRAIGRFDPAGPARLSTWILTIARRLCRDLAARTRVRGTAPMRESPARDTGPEGQLLAAAIAERVRAAFQALPEDQRAALALRSWEALDYEEIARIEAVPVGTVRSR